MFKPKKKTKRDKIALRTQEESLKQDKLQTGGDQSQKTLMSNLVFEELKDLAKGDSMTGTEIVQA